MAKSLADVSLADILPGSITWDGTIANCIAAVDPSLSTVAGLIGQVLIYSRIDELPSPVIDALAWQFHVDFYRPWLSLPARRELVENALDWHRSKGTPGALTEIIDTLTGVATTIRERPYFLTEQSRLDADTLGAPAHPAFLTEMSMTDADILGCGYGGPFEFDVLTPSSVAMSLNIARQDLEAIMEVMRPARSKGTVRFHGFHTDSDWSLTNTDLL